MKIFEMWFGNLSGNQWLWFLSTIGLTDSFTAFVTYSNFTTVMVIRLVEQATDEKKEMRLYKIGYQ